MTKKLLLLFALISLVGCGQLEPTNDPEEPVDPVVDPVDPIEYPDSETALPTTGEQNYIVILIETNDVHFSISNPKQAFSDMLNKEGYSDYGGTGSVRDYFKDQSMGKYKPKFDVYGPVEVNHPMSSFTASRGLTKFGAQRLLGMACDQLDSLVDFSKYDTNGNGLIDNVFFYYAGYNSADGPDNAIWPHAGVVNYKQCVYDKVKLLDYGCTSELKGAEGTNMARIGNFCHEFAHILGLPDLYDTNTGKADGVGDFSLMHSGCYNNNGNTPPSLNCEERLLLGWLDEIPSLPAVGSDTTLGPISTNVAYKSDTENKGEYFCYEYRDGTGWDAYVPKGLVIYHIDKSKNIVNGKTAEYRWKHLIDLNGDPSHECFDLVKASDSNVVFGIDSDEFSPVSWSGTAQSYSIKDISVKSAVIELKVR